MLLLAAGLAWGQAAHPALAHLVHPTPGTRPLGDVLAELSRQGQLPFSYSSSLVPVAHRCTLRPGPARPLRVVLREVLAAEHLSYGLLAGQLVLWPDRLAPPAGVAAVNGRATVPVRPARSLVPSVAAPATGRAAETPEEAAPNGSSARLSGSASGPKALLSTLAKPTPSATASPKVVAERPLRSGKAVRSTGFTARSGPNSASNSRSVVRLPRVLATAKQVSAKPGSESKSATVLRGTQRRARPAGRGQTVTRQPASASSSARATGPPQPRPGQIAEPLALLAPLFVPVKSGLEAGNAPPLVPGPAGLPSASGRNTASKPFQAVDSAVRQPRVLAGLLRRGYFHGEAWGSESLPLNAAVKLGVPRLYLVLGAAAGPFGRQTDWAWGVGAGTTGRLRGRFTPSLDLLHWFVADDRETTHGRLTQLRPALAWQFRQGGRWQLVGGPTLNLATARHDRGRPPRWELGQNQWLWLDSSEGPSLLRLWPGVQLGVRF